MPVYAGMRKRHIIYESSFLGLWEKSHEQLSFQNHELWLFKSIAVLHFHLLLWRVLVSFVT